MTKAEVIVAIADKTGVDKASVSTTLESFFEIVKGTLAQGDAVYVRGFGSFVIKRRAEKTGRNITKNTPIIIPAHNIPSFKPVKTFVNKVKNSVK